MSHIALRPSTHEGSDSDKSFYYRNPRDRLYAAKMSHLEHQWAFEQVDSAIIRVLKAEPQGKCASTELCEKAMHLMRTHNRKRYVDSATILERCDN